VTVLAYAVSISGIIILGLMLQTSAGSGRADSVSVILALVGVGFASVNILGGFIVTQKMLQMFHK
jgi:NAD(P) transhydrogenase subunit alpha